jgi:HNH endonuclease
MDKLEPTLDKRCGTYAGYRAHRKRDEQLCMPCREAMREHRRKTYKPELNRKYREKYTAAHPERVKEQQKKHKKVLDPEVKAARKAERARAAAKRAELRKQEKQALRQAKLAEMKEATRIRREAKAKEKAEISAQKQAALAAKYAAMNTAREERKAAEKAERAAARKAKSKAARHQRNEERKARRLEREKQRALLDNQHGTTVGDYERCRKNHGSACEKCRAVAAKYAREKFHSDPKYREAEKRWRKANPNKLYRDSKDRALKYGGKHKYYTRQHIFDRDGYDCYLCSTPVDLTANHIVGQPGWELYPHIEHVHPLSKGGDDTLDNVKIAHAKCNMDKGAQFNQATA